MPYTRTEKIEMMIKSIKENKEEDREEKHCVVCNGSGEGMYDGSTCTSCKGLGVKIKEYDTTNSSRMVNYSSKFRLP